MRLALLAALAVSAAAVPTLAQSRHNGHPPAELATGGDAQLAKLVRLLNEANVGRHIRAVSVSLNRSGRATSVKVDAVHGAAPAAVAFARRVRATRFGATPVPAKRHQIRLQLLD